jgi:hypothetical protein
MLTYFEVDKSENLNGLFCLPLTFVFRNYKLYVKFVWKP